MPLSSHKLQNSVSSSEIIRRLSYDPVSGVIRRAVAGGGSKIGTIVGKETRSGYLAMGIMGKSFLCHRIAWLLHHGEWPHGEVDHINRDKTDNRLSNLRLSTRQENMRNSKRRKENTSGYKGVSFSGQHQRYRARISYNGKRHSLGLHDTASQASEALREVRYQWHGKFAREE